MLGKSLGYDSFHSVACSGAVTDDITNTSIPSSNNKSQASGKDDPSFDDKIYSNFLPGYRAQLNFVTQYQPQAITVSIGGNDIGFSQILLRCLEPDTCYSTYEDRLELITEFNKLLFPRLIDTYQTIKNSAPPGANIYAIGYPQIAKPNGNCGDNVHLNAQETVFSEQIINYLDRVIQSAASYVGVGYVDTQDALDGHRLCEAPPGGTAINGLTAGNDRPTRLGPIGAESYHPNALGHQLLEEAILRETNDLTEPMPAADSTSQPPDESEQDILNAPKSGRPLNGLNYDDSITNNVLYRSGAWSITLKSGGFLFVKPISKVKAVLNSTPLDLGEFTTDQNGSLNATVQTPADIETGFHVLHLYGTNVANQPIDVYKVVYVADDQTSFAPTAGNPCVVVPPSGDDYDQDGLDDACDPNITQPPVQAAVSDSTASSSGPAQSTASGFRQTKPLAITASDNSTTNPSPPTAAPVVLAENISQPSMSVNKNNESSRVSWWIYVLPAGFILTLASGFAVLRR